MFVALKDARKVKKFELVNAYCARAKMVRDPPHKCLASLFDIAADDPQ